MADLLAASPAPVMKPLDPWGVQLVGSSSDERALVARRRLQEKYAPILGGREPRVFHHGLARGSMGWARVHVGADSRVSAEKLCAQLRAAGASCTGAAQLKLIVAIPRSRCERPISCRAAEQRYELAAPHHSITSSARPSSGSGTASPSALAVLRLRISSTFVACCTGSSAGFSPLRMRPV